MTRFNALATPSPWAARRLTACCRLRRAASTAAASTAAGRLDFQAIDAKWRKRWARPAAASSASAAPGLPTSYILPMFPYPSGTLHLGHLRVYTISDVLARYKHMRGHRVIHPMGWDAFGLPAENAAIERGIDPADWTLSNIAKMKEQLEAMNGRWDWDREFMTCDPSFYKHTQRLFLLLHERGLAYQAESLVNWDPVDGTVLANEQVDASGCSWRSGAKVEKLRLKQWFLRITAFKEALLEDLDLLAKDNRWPERVLSMQKNWLGKSRGTKVQFKIESPHDGKKWPPVEVFTTRLDTLFGVHYVALSLNHPIVQDLANTTCPEIHRFAEQVRNLPPDHPDSKLGFVLPGVHAINPASSLDSSTPQVQNPVPVYVAPYVLEDYGTGAVMGVPGHDSRDHAFWGTCAGKAPIVKVVAPGTSLPSTPKVRIPGTFDRPFVHKGKLTEASGPLNGLTSDEAIDKIVELLREKGQPAEHTDNWSLRDWLISRQRYWGTPIPIIHCDSCGAVPVPESELPVVLPKLKPDQLLGKGGNPLADIPEWVNTSCPKCHGPAKRETDTMDTFMDSSWYFFRFADPHNEDAPISPAVADANLPVDVYIGGVEHAILHLLYARFISKFLATTALWPSGGGPDNKGEPFRKLITQGMVHGKTYSDPATGRFLKAEEVDLSHPSSPKIFKTGDEPNVSFEKMSKSKHNGVDPGSCIAKYGADATRAHMLFQAPVSEVLEWDEGRIVGIQRWMYRVWRITQDAAAMPRPDPTKIRKLLEVPAANALTLRMHQTIKSVNTALDSTYSLNTVISDLIKFTNSIDDEVNAVKMGDVNPQVTNFPLEYRTAVKYLLCMMAPITPAFAEECYEVLVASDHETALSTSTSTGTSIFDVRFPDHSPALIEACTHPLQTCAVQLNGKVKFIIDIPVPDASLLKPFNQSALDEWVIEQIMATKKGQFWFGIDAKRSLQRNKVRKVIVVKGGKTVNFVVPKTSHKAGERARRENSGEDE